LFVGQSVGAANPIHPLHADVIAKMIRQLAQHATTTIRVIIMLPTWVIDGILAAAMRLALQQAQLTQQRRMIRQSHQSAREQRDAFQINLALGLVALHVADAGLQPSARHSLGGIGIAVHHADTVLAAQFGVFQRDRTRVELALRASDQIEHVLLAVEVDFTSADLSGADLSDADLRGAKLVATKLIGAKLPRAKLNLAWIMRADFSHADLSQSIFKTLVASAGMETQPDEAAKFIEANLSGAKVTARFSLDDMRGRLDIRSPERPSTFQSILCNARR
jgi:hypothetical protein